MVLWLHKRSLSLGAERKVVFTPALVNVRLSWWETSGMYVMHAYVMSCLSTEKGRMSNSSLALFSLSLSWGFALVAVLALLFWPCCFGLADILVVVVGGGTNCRWFVVSRNLLARL